MRCFFKLSTLIVLSLAASPVVNAQQSSAPNFSKLTAPPIASVKTFKHSTVRLLKGDFKDGVWQVGVEIKMAPHWKTYWKIPGDAGVPPEFVWEKSSNLKSADVSFPAPNRYEDVTGKSIGYKKHVIFPVTIKPSTDGKPVKVDLQLYYAICSDICVPAQANIGFELPATGSSFSDQNKIDVFNAQVPKADETRIGVNKAEVLRVNGKPNLAISLSGQLDKKTDILVEGFEDAIFGEPSTSRKGNGETVFLLPIDELEKDTMLSGKTLKLTVLSGDIRLVSDVVVK